MNINAIILRKNNCYLKSVSFDLLDILFEFGILKENFSFYLPADMNKTHLVSYPNNGRVVIVRRDWSDCTESELQSVKKSWEGIFDDFTKRSPEEK